VTKPITSPEAPQPKQWKSPFAEDTLKDAVLSKWNGHGATSCRPFFLSAMPRSATTDTSSFADLIRSIPSFVTCIPPPLLCTQRLESHVLQAPDFRLEKPQVHESLATVVVTYRFVEARAADPEDREASPVRAAYLDASKLAPADEPEGPEEEVVGLQHWTLPWTAGGEVG